ncbi:MAG: winged helix-turn-helix transcriptional regulator [Nitrospirae bacterium]|nr:winged helix-turn-helix transcriptional regulator [Nitrospirota bacterium]
MPPSIENADTEKEPFNRESMHTLRILDEVATGKPLTQRDLSQKLGIALGMTNNYLKRLARLGYIQIVQAERKRLHYLLTPKGIAEKSALTYRYIKRSYQFFMEIRQKMGRFFEALSKDGVRSVVFYRATVITEIAVLVLQDSPLRLLAIVDDELAGQKFLGYPVEPVKALREMKFDRVLITAEDSVEKVAEHLGRHDVTKERICSIQ